MSTGNTDTDLPSHYVRMPEDEGRTTQDALRQPQQSDEVVVETVHSDDEDSERANRKHQDNNKTSPPPVKLVLGCMPQTTRQAVRCSMTLLFGLLTVGLVFTFLAVQQYRLVVGVVWTVLVFLFVALVYVVQTAALEGNSRRFVHPLVHAMADLIVQEVEGFQHDWREQVLLLTHEGEEGRRNAAETVDNTERDAEHNAEPPPAQPKSRIFRTLVQPLLPLLRRKSRQPTTDKKKRKEKKKRHRRGRSPRRRQRDDHNNNQEELI